MIQRGPKGQNKSRTRPLVARVYEDTARDFCALAKKHGVTQTTLFHEAVALLFRDEGVPLPAALVEHLRLHGRPIPTGAMLQKATCDLN